MTLAASGQISMGGSTASQSINLEVGNPAFAQSSLNDPESRRLSTKTTNNSVHSLTDFYSKTFANPSGTLWLWGHNTLGQLGNNTRVNKSSLVQTIASGTNWKSIAGGTYHSLAIKTDGTLWAWGHNYSGQLGNNTRVNRSSPVQTIASGTNWKSIASGGFHSLAIKTDGTLWTWGYNSYGQLGNNTTVHRSSPVQTIAGGTNWKLVAGAYYHSLAIKTDGTLWTWGHNAYGQLGDNTIVNRSSPVQTIAGGTNWKSIAAGYTHSLALKTDGTLWTWGYSIYGQLGNNTTVYRFSPVQTIASGTNWKSIAAGFYHSLAIKTDGTLWTWGHNAYGQLGDNTTVDKSSPVQTIAGGTNWKSIASEVYHSLAIKTDGTLWAWGRNDYGQLGDNTKVNRSSPVQTIASGTNWKLVASGAYHSLAIRDEYEDLL